jgi:hypothetical protein
MKSWATTIATLGLSILAGQCLGQPLAEPDPKPAEIRAWIQQLGSSRFAEREEAEKRLLKSEAAIVYVKEAIRNENSAEIRKRCTQILEQRKLLMRDDVFRLLDEMCRRGEFARAMATAYEWRYVLRERLRDHQLNAAQLLVAIIEKKSGGSIKSPKLEEKLELVLEERTQVGNVFHYLFAGREIEFNLAVQSAFLVAGDLKNSGRILKECLLFAKGNVVLSDVLGSVVWVDGDLTLGYADKSVVVCTGKVDSVAGLKNSLIIAGGKIQQRSDTKINTIVRSEEKELVELVRPWNASDLGVELTARDGRIHAGRVGRKTPMSRAGVEAGDILLSFDGEKIATPDGAVKLLRRKSAELLPFVVRVKRGDRELELIVPMSVK